MSTRSFYLQSLLLTVLLLLTQTRGAAQCTVDPGTLLPGPHYVCPGSSFAVPYATQPTQGANDTVACVIHDGTATTLGNVVAYTLSNWNSFPTGVLPTSGTYQLALLGGHDTDGDLLPDAGDPCYVFSGGATVTFAVSPTLTVTPASSQLSCANPSVQINSSVTPAGNYNYNWLSFNGNTPVGPNPVINQAGDYFLRVEDPVTGCRDSTIVVVNGSINYWAYVSAIVQDCEVGGELILRCTTSLTNNTTYLWSNGATTQEIEVSSATPANYCVTITDGTGCTAVACRDVQPSPGFTANIIYYSFGCPDTLNGLYVNTNFQTENTYLWNDGTISPYLPAPSEAGLYSVTVTSVTLGCTAVATYFLEEVNVCGVAQGRVWGDLDETCTNSAGDVGLGGILVKLKHIATGTEYLSYTNSGGQWGHSVEAGAYTVQVVEPNNVWSACQSTFNINVPANSAATRDFYLQPEAECPRLEVDLSNSFLRRCFSGIYWVRYCNTGTVTAEDAYVDITFDPFLTFNQNNSTLTGESQGNNTWRFQVGDVAVGECDNFAVYVDVSCDATLGQTHCTEATIYPHEPCGEDPVNWSGASLIVTGECEPDSVRFTVKNVGSGPSSLLNYVVIEDAVMFLTAPPPTVTLDSAETHVVAVPANGATWRMDVEQEPGHPGMSMPSVTIEGCGTPASQGFVNQFPMDDADYWKDIDCSENVDSYDPNDKQGFPTGYAAEHYIERGTDIEYLIRFQNTGTAPAFTVVIRDTLSAFLDPATLRPGASSHPYEVDFYGNGPNLKFTFNNINLPDSSSNLAGSQGFVSFRISQKADVPLETDILNTAAIYFDFNEPIFTNTTQHRLGEDFVTVSTWAPVQPQLQLGIVPNPMNNVATLSVKGLNNGAECRVELLDALGRTVSSGQTTGNTWQIQRGSLPSGYYTLRVVSLDNGLVGVGKIVVK